MFNCFSTGGAQQLAVSHRQPRQNDTCVTAERPPPSRVVYSGQVLPQRVRGRVRHRWRDPFSGGVANGNNPENQPGGVRCLSQRLGLQRCFPEPQVAQDSPAVDRTPSWD